jgi:hypothetical protein
VLSGLRQQLVMLRAGVCSCESCSSRAAQQGMLQGCKRLSGWACVARSNWLQTMCVSWLLELDGKPSTSQWLTRCNMCGVGPPGGELATVPPGWQPAENHVQATVTTSLSICEWRVFGCAASTFAVWPCAGISITNRQQAPKQCVRHADTSEWFCRFHALLCTTVLR